ncbi:MAG TPA: translation initiation factor eIF-2B [Roseiflexaceae bacterium]|nr:translation initiation factor eIF-2B [Roseiflexaceae bacterium]HMP39470.1 translation initiation factor eIF-2B [Roseiflexaceae bacterium]
MKHDIERLIEDLVAEHQHGAIVVAEHAADILKKRVSSGEPSSPEAFRRELLLTGWALIRAFPTMAPLVNLVNSVLWKAEESEAPHELRSIVIDATDDFKHQLRQRPGFVAERALPLINDGTTIVTISSSTTVRQALLHAQRAGRRFSVICAESRPRYEGQELAAALAAAGIPTQLMIDTAAIEAVPTAHLVLVGADMLSMRGLVNKIGTSALAVAAQHARVPFYTLCGSEKFLPPGFPQLEQHDWNADEIWLARPEGAAVVNRYFDTTPLHLISGIVTERGTLTVAAIEAWLATARLHPVLTGVAATHGILT